MSNKSETEKLMLVWNNFLSGNEKAFSELYEMLVRDLYAFGATQTAYTELIKDCIQDVFVRLYSEREELGSVTNVKIYILIALKNALKDAFKKKQTVRKYIDSYEDEEQTEDSIEEKIIAEETNTNLKNMVTKFKSVLSERQQEIIHLRFVEGLPIEEISKLLNINYQSVANSIQKSLQKIRTFYLKR